MAIVHLVGRLVLQGGTKPSEFVMRIPGADKAIDNLIAWSQREEWGPLREQVLADHFDEVFDRFGTTMDGLAEQLGDHAISMVYPLLLHFSGCEHLMVV